jgi:hypothetical protein
MLSYRKLCGKLIETSVFFSKNIILKDVEDTYIWTEEGCGNGRMEKIA